MQGRGSEVWPAPQAPVEAQGDCGLPQGLPGGAASGIPRLSSLLKNQDEDKVPGLHSRKHGQGDPGRDASALAQA